MNTPRSVAYGWAALCVATGIGYYMAKGVNEDRWREQRARGLRSTDRSDWKEKVARAEAQEAAKSGDGSGAGGNATPAAAASEDK